MDEVWPNVKRKTQEWPWSTLTRLFKLVQEFLCESPMISSTLFVMKKIVPFWNPIDRHFSFQLYRLPQKRWCFLEKQNNCRICLIEMSIFVLFVWCFESLNINLLHGLHLFASTSDDPITIDAKFQFQCFYLFFYSMSHSIQVF